MELIWAVLGLYWAPVGQYWGSHGASWAVLGGLREPSWGPLGAICGPSLAPGLKSPRDGLQVFPGRPKWRPRTQDTPQRAPEIASVGPAASKFTSRD